MLKKIKQIKFDSSLTPLIKGNPSSYEEAIKEIQKIIKTCKGIHIDGMGCDLKGIDKILDFSEENYASVDHMSGDEVANFYSIYQKEGGMIVSLGELRNRSDMILFVNITENELSSNFLSEIVKNKKNKKLLVFLSKKHINNPHYKHFKSKNLCEDIMWLKNNFFDLNANLLIKNKKIESLLSLLKKTNYGVIVFKVDLNNNYLTKCILEFVKIINKKSRFHIFLYGGENNLAGFVQSSLWRTGFPQRYNFTSNGAIYNPTEFNDEVMKIKKELQIFISCFKESPSINYFKRNIFIGNGYLKNKKLFDVFIPTSVPGIDETGLLVRCDHSCVLKLEKIIQTNYKSVSEIFSLMNSNEN